MRRLALCALPLFGLLLTVLPAAAQSPKEIVEKAIAAAGGEAVKKQADSPMSWNSKGKVYVQGLEIEFKGESFRQPPGKMRQNLEMEVQGNAMKMSIAMNGKEGWMAMNDAVQDMPEGQLKAGQDEQHVSRFVSLQALLGSDVTLESLGASDIDGKKVVGIKAVQKDRPDVKLFFDAGSHMLVKAEFKTVDAQTMGDITQEMYFSDYKDFAGVKRATKVLVKRDGEKFLELQMSDFKVLDKVDEKMFDKPAT